MGWLVEALDYDPAHEGYAVRKLHDGSYTTSRATGRRTQPTKAYVAECACGWRGNTEHPPTEDGEEAAEHEWATVHLPQEARGEVDAAREHVRRVLTRVLADFDAGRATGTDIVGAGKQLTSAGRELDCVERLIEKKR